MRVHNLLVTLLIVFIASGPLFAQEDLNPEGKGENGRITGRMMIKGGGSMSGGVVRFYNVNSLPPPSPEKYWRVPDDIADIEEDGRFSSELIAGDYYVEAVKRVSGETVGPLDGGDYFFTGRDKDGKLIVYSIKAGAVADLGVVTEAKPFEPESAEMTTGFQGMVHDNDMKPVAGTIVFAFRSPALSEQPVFVSTRTGDDGRYTLRVDEGGTYYLRVRDIYGGGPPHGGALISGYSAKQVSVKSGTVSNNINIQVRKSP